MTNLNNKSAFHILQLPKNYAKRKFLVGLLSFTQSKQNVFTLAEPLIVQRTREILCLRKYSRTSKPKEPLNSIKKQTAFTLAEVLITLAIIGVVAALTIPSVIHNYQKQETVTRLKKTYSALVNTTNLAIADYGSVTGWSIGENKTKEAAAEFNKKYLTPYLNVLKNCGTNSEGDCTVSTVEDAFSAFFLNDGVKVYTTIENLPDIPALTAVIIIDINGDKKPNKFGKDRFTYRYIVNHRYFPNQSGKIVPQGYGVMITQTNGVTDRSKLMVSGDGAGCKQNGVYCTAVIMADGWQIKSDYPW